MIMMFSVIVPAYNEAENIGSLVRYLKAHAGENILEIIVCDGGSTDGTTTVAANEGAKIILSAKKGRAVQMNDGGSVATGRFLYFLHADTIPPKDYTQQIIKASDDGFKSGCFRLHFDHPHWFLKANCWFTRFDNNYFRFGDQSLFVTKEVFQQTGGFNEKLIVLEDQEIIPRIRKYCRFKVMKGHVITSARKYLLNGIYKTQAVYFLIYLMYKLRFSQKKLVNTYRYYINQNKV